MPGEWTVGLATTEPTTKDSKRVDAVVLPAAQQDADLQALLDKDKHGVRVKTHMMPVAGKPIA